MIKLFIVDDHNVVIEGVLSLLQNSQEITVCGFSYNASTCLSFLERNDVDVVLMDINLHDMSGLDLCKNVKAAYPDMKIIALSTYNQVSYIHKMTLNGANGYLLKNVTKDELTEAIKTVFDGKIFYSFEVNEILRIAQCKTEAQPILTKREMDILKLIVEGLTNPQIGERLFISTDTVDTHRKNLHTKLGVNNTALLVRDMPSSRGLCRFLALNAFLELNQKPRAIHESLCITQNLNKS